MKRAVVVADGRLQMEAALGALAAAGFEAVAVASAAEVRPHVELGAAVVVIGFSGSASELAHLAPLAAMPAGLRRSFVAILVGANLTTGDGLKAFLLGVDMVVGVGDMVRLGELACSAVAAKRSLVAPLDPAAAARLGG